MVENKFGGSWTRAKIDILKKYTVAYLNIMNKHASKWNWKLLYFDGFAGSGVINDNKGIVEENSNQLLFELGSETSTSIEDQEAYVGAAIEIISIDNPISFDMYYFVEQNPIFHQSLQEEISKFKKKAYVVNADFNDKAKSLAAFLRENKNYKTLAYIDPFAMNVEWASIELLSGLSVDMWMLLPTGALNRLLVRNGNIQTSWIRKLEVFLGMTEAEIRAEFYSKTIIPSLFGDYESVQKNEDAIGRAFDVYKKRLGHVFNYISEPYELKNKNNTRLFHFFLASQNKTAVTIANDLIKKNKH